MNMIATQHVESTSFEESACKSFSKTEKNIGVCVQDQMESILKSTK